MVVNSAQNSRIAGIVLAGGQARRLGGDKALRPLGGTPLLAHAIARAAPQVAALALSANGDPAPFQAFALPILADSVPGFVGPLAGILAGLDWAAREGMDTLASFACDAPFFPRDLVARLGGGAGAGRCRSSPPPRRRTAASGVRAVAGIACATNCAARSPTTACAKSMAGARVTVR